MTILSFYIGNFKRIFSKYFFSLLVLENLIFEFIVSMISTFKKLDIMTVIFGKFQNEKELKNRKKIHTYWNKIDKKFNFGQKF